MNENELIVAMIGTSDQVSFMRMAGIGAWRIIREEGNIREQVQSALRDFRKDDSIGIIIIPDDLTEHITDVLAKMRQEKKITPVIIEIPTQFDQGPEHIKEFYQLYAKRLIGFSIEI